MTDMARWERLADTLADIAPVTVDRFGESRQICIRSGRTLILIHDTWWRDHWTGWEVYTEGADSIVQRTYPRTKKRGEVRRNVADALAAIDEPRR